MTAGISLIVAPWVLSFGGVRDATTDFVVGILAVIRAVGTYAAEWPSCINALVAIWLVVSPWVLKFATDQVPFWNTPSLGAIVFVLSLAVVAARPPVSVTA